MRKKQAKGNVVVVQTTVAGSGKARQLAQLLVKTRLAACVQYFPVKSIYRWKGRIESAAEYLLLAKTVGSLAGKLAARIRREHPYELPEIVVTKLDGGLSEYFEWVRSVTIQKR